MIFKSIDTHKIILSVFFTKLDGPPVRRLNKEMMIWQIYQKLRNMLTITGYANTN